MQVVFIDRCLLLKTALILLCERISEMRNSSPNSCLPKLVWAIECSSLWPLKRGKKKLLMKRGQLPQICQPCTKVLIWFERIFRHVLWFMQQLRLLLHLWKRASWGTRGAYFSETALRKQAAADCIFAFEMRCTADVNDSLWIPF